MRALLALSLLAGCSKDVPDAPAAFSDAMINAFVQFDADDETFVEAVREVERQVYLAVDPAANRVGDRALAPRSLTDEAVEGLERPDVDVGDALPVAVAGLSEHVVDQHAVIPLLADQTPVEPYSPDEYDREFLEGEDCWGDRRCSLLRTYQHLVKDNILMSVPYTFYKDFRWIDLGDDAPRWAYVARSWQDEIGVGDSGKNKIIQSFTVEFWIPRDGEGFLMSESEDDPAGDWTTDSRGGGTLRALSLWTQVELSLDVPDETVVETSRTGIDKNFRAADGWIDDNL